MLSVVLLRDFTFNILLFMAFERSLQQQQYARYIHIHFLCMYAYFLQVNSVPGIRGFNENFRCSFPNFTQDIRTHLTVKSPVQVFSDYHQMLRPHNLFKSMDIVSRSECDKRARLI